MAKKGAVRKSKVKAKTQAAVVTVVKKEPVKAEEKKKMNKPAVIIFIAVVFLLFVGQIVFVMKKQIVANKKPILVNSWKVDYGIQTAMPVSGSSLFIIDTKFNQIKRYDKAAGRMLEIFQFETAPKWAWEASDGKVYVLLKGDGNIYLVEKNRKPKALFDTGFTNIQNFVLNSKDEAVLIDGDSGKIVKYSLDGTVIKEFGGKGSESGKFRIPGRIFIDSKDKIYVIDSAAPFKVKVFSEEGSFVKDWPLANKSLAGVEGLAITNDGNVYINDWDKVCIRVHNNDGKVLGEFVNDDSMSYRITPPSALSGGQDNYIYVNSFNFAQFEPIKY